MKYTGPVRFILKGDANLAMNYTSRSRLFLQQAMDRMGPDKAYWNRILPDGTEITVSSLGGINQVWITTPAPEDVSGLKRGYLVLSSVEDQYYPIFKYNPYQVVNDPTTDTEAGNVEWVGSDGRIVSWDGLEDRYDGLSSGTIVYYRGTQYSETPSAIAGAAIAANHLVVITTNSKIYHRPFTAGGYSDASLYNPDTNVNGWREVSAPSLNVSNMSSVLSASPDGLNWVSTSRNGLAEVYTWSLVYDSENNTFQFTNYSSSSLDEQDYSTVNSNTPTYSVCGTLTKHAAELGGGYYNYDIATVGCYDQWTGIPSSPGIRGYSLTYNSDEKTVDSTTYLGNYDKKVGSDFDRAGNQLFAGLRAVDFHKISSVGRDVHTADAEYIRAKVPPDFGLGVLIQQSSIEENRTYTTTGLTTNLHKWYVGNLTKEAIDYYADSSSRLEERLTSESYFESASTSSFWIPVAPTNPSLVLFPTGTPPEQTGYSSHSTTSAYESRVLFFDIRYSSAVYVDYRYQDSDGTASIMWSVPGTDVEIASQSATKANVPFTLKGMNPSVDYGDIFASFGAAIDGSKIQVHHIDMIPDSNDLVLFIDVTFYGTRYTKTYSIKNAGSIIESTSIAEGHDVSAIKAL